MLLGRSAWHSDLDLRKSQLSQVKSRPLMALE